LQYEPSCLASGTELGVDAGEALAALLEALLRWRRFGGRQPEKRAASFEVLPAVVGAEQAEVADAHEAKRQDVDEETTDEFGGVDLLDAPLAIALVILVAEEDVLAIHAE
jgi:hypothetical protein